MPEKSIAQAHREAACVVVSARWGMALARAANASLADHQKAETEALIRIEELTAIESPPDDVIEYRDQYFQNVRDRLMSEQRRLDTIVNNPEVAKLLYPVVTEPNPAAVLASTNHRIATLDSVWTPGGES